MLSVALQFDSKYKQQLIVPWQRQCKTCMTNMNMCHLKQQATQDEIYLLGAGVLFIEQIACLTQCMSMTE